MDEKLLQYAWKTLRFPLQSLRTTTGQPVHIRHQGRLNTHQGPDFLDAALVIDNMHWRGAVEIHRHTHQWYQHRHHQDARYNATVLHVVGRSTGVPVFRADGTPVPELALGALLNPCFTANYQRMQTELTALPCAYGIDQVPAFVQSHWLERMGWERLQQKSEAQLPQLAHYRGDWEQLLWVQLCAALGAPLNTDPFTRLAGQLPASVVRRYLAQPLQLEALLLGMAGMLHHPADDYLQSLAQEWQYLQQKHQLAAMPPEQFVHLRMRPANFPGLRLAQLAALLHRLPHLFALIEQPALLHTPVQASAYWDTHYMPGKPGSARPKRLGRQALDHLVINAIVPFAACYYARAGKAQEDSRERLQGWLQQLAPEDNHITRIYTALGTSNTDAFRSQALLHLHKQYCSHRRCTECAVGHHLLKSPI
ncbi:MAG: DUF2851 family protein [Bacteroidetes bacterium]|nr:DUF2851 family protein [Bacteroidota bacterium]